VHAASFGIFTCCLSLAGRRTGRLLPDPLGALSPPSLIVRPAMWLIPVGPDGNPVTGWLSRAVADTVLREQGPNRFARWA